MRSFQTLLALVCWVAGSALIPSGSHAAADSTHQYAAIDQKLERAERQPHADLRMMRIKRGMLTVCEWGAASILATFAHENDRASFAEWRQWFIEHNRCMAVRVSRWQPNLSTTTIGEMSDDGSSVTIVMESASITATLNRYVTVHDTGHVVCWKTQNEQHCF